MAKMFERAEIESNDDGTFSVSVTPVEKKKEGKDGETAMIGGYRERRRATCQSFEEVSGKIDSMCKGDMPDKKQMSDGEKLNDYFNGAKYTADKEEDSEKN